MPSKKIIDAYAYRYILTLQFTTFRGAGTLVEHASNVIGKDAIVPKNFIHVNVIVLARIFFSCKNHRHQCQNDKIPCHFARQFFLDGKEKKNLGRKFHFLLE